MVEITVYEKLPIEIKEEIKKLRLKEYVRSPQEIQEHEDKFPGIDNYKTLIGTEDGKVAGRVKLFKRTIQFQGEPVVVGGVGGVWTRKANRRKGVASTLLKQAMEILKEDNCDIALLNTNIKKLGALYGAVGFQALGHLYSFVGKSGKSYFEDNAMIAPVNSLDLFYKIAKDSKPLDIGNGSW